MLNEVVINKGVFMIELELIIDNDFVCRDRADGLIVASPTGSTAYSLSAEWPLCASGGGVFIITPICPHTLSDRPVVRGHFHHFEAKLSVGPNWIFLTLDGQKGIPLQPTDRVAGFPGAVRTTFKTY